MVEGPSTLPRARRSAMAGSNLGASRYGSMKGDTDMDVSVEIHCEACGSANYSLPDGAGDGSPIRCNDCGADQGSVGELKAVLAAQALDHSAEALRRRLDTLRAADA